MSDTEIIREYLEVSIPNDHPALYQFIMGRERSQQSAVNNIAKLTDGILSPPYTIGHIRTVIRAFLRHKKKQYQKGLIEIKPIY